MSCIHFKFKSSLEYEKLTFDGLHISLSDLKEAIMKQKKIGGFNQYTLCIVDAQSKKEFKDDQEMIPRNTSVIISRVPITNPTKLPKTQRKDPSLLQPESVSMTTTSAPSSIPPPLTSQRQLTVGELQETADLASANATEEDKVKAMMTQSSKDYDPSRYVSVASKGPSLVSLKKNPPPPNYICHRCGKKGHWIQFCPTNGDPSYDNRNFKRSVGTPASQIISAPVNMPGVMVDRHGNLVVRKVDYSAFMATQTKVKPEAPVKLEIPTELVCPLCKKLVKDAVIIQCCSESFCYECIQEHLCENEFTCPLCKATDVSPETLVPNKALRTAAKNFQMKEMEQKSASEARGYVPIVTPHHAAMSVKNLPTAVDSSTSGAGGGEAGKVADGPTGTPADKEKEKKDSLATTKTEEPKAELNDAADLPATSKNEEEKAKPSEKRPSPAPQQPRLKNKSEALLDRILSSSTATSKKTPPPPAPAAPPPAKKIPSSTASLPAVSLLAPKVPPNVSSALLGTSQQTAVVSTALTAVDTALAAPLVAGSALLTGGAGILGLPRASTKSTLPGQGAVLTTTAVLPPVVVSEPPAEDTSKLERIAAELLLSSATAVSKKGSTPPLSAEEFYRQQKMLKLFTKQSRKRTPSPYSSASSESRSSTPDSYISHRSFSDSSSMSRSRSPSYSSYSDSRSRSRSRSPLASHHSHRSKKHRKYHKRDKARPEKTRERGRERKSTHHSKRKRKRHLSPDTKQRDSKSKHSKSRHRAASPDRKKYRDGHTPSSLTMDDRLSPDSTLGTLTPELVVESHRKTTSSLLLQHKRHSKGRSKHKHRHRERNTDEVMDMEQESVGGGQGIVGGVRTNNSINMEQKLAGKGRESASQKEGGRRLMESSEEMQEGVAQEIKADAGGSGNVIGKGSTSNLVPYQDSSTTEAESHELDELGPETASSQRVAGADTSRDQTITEVEPMQEVLSVIEQRVNGDSILDERANGQPGKGGEREGGGVVHVDGEADDIKPVEDALMISLHVDDTIDDTATDLVDAECPTAGREDGELTDSDKEDEEDDKAPLSSSQRSQVPSSQRNSSLNSVASPPTMIAVSADGDITPGRENESDVDLRVILEKQKHKKQKSSKKQFASAVTVASGNTLLAGNFVSSSQSSAIKSEWSCDEEEDSESSNSESNSEVKDVRVLSKSASRSKHSSSSSSSKKYKRKHDSSKSHKDKDKVKEKEKKRKRQKDHKVSSESKKNARKEREREREREEEKERARKRKKHKLKKSSDKYVKYSH